mgnify:CR=1 FL=1
MKKEDVNIKDDGTIECFIVLSNNPCIVVLTPIHSINLETLREKIDESDDMYLSKDDIYKFCRNLSDKKIFSNITIVNPHKKVFGQVIEVNENLDYEDSNKDLDQLYDLIFVQNKASQEKSYYCHYTM